MLTVPQRFRQTDGRTTYDVGASDVKFHESFWREIFHEIFKKFHVFSGSRVQPI